eukprot:400726-Amphidinium_carterae.1
MTLEVYELKRELLCIPGADLGCCDHAGLQPLHHAAINGAIPTLSAQLHANPLGFLQRACICNNVAIRLTVSMQSRHTTCGVKVA